MDDWEVVSCVAIALSVLMFVSAVSLLGKSVFSDSSAVTSAVDILLVSSTFITKVVILIPRETPCSRKLLGYDFGLSIGLIPVPFFDLSSGINSTGDILFAVAIIISAILSAIIYECRINVWTGKHL